MLPISSTLHRTKAELYAIRKNCYVGLKCLNFDTISTLKQLGLFRARGKSGGKSRRISTVIWTQQPAHFNQQRSKARSIQVLSHNKPVVVNRSVPRFLTMLEKSPNRLDVSHYPSFVLTNVRSINNKLHHLPLLKSSHPADVYALTETWLTPDTASSVWIPGYTHIHCTRTSNKGGGVSIFVSGRFDVTKEDNICNSDVEICSINLTSTTASLKSYSHTVLVLYRPPSGNVENAETAIRQTLLNFAATHAPDHTTVMGDLNRMCTAEIETEFSLKQVVQFNTRENAKLDLILTNCANFYNSPRKCCPISSSDHCVIEWHPTNKCREPAQVLRKVTVYDRRAQFMQKAEDTLARADWRSVVHQETVEDSYHHFHSTVISALNCIPARLVNITNRDPIWMTGIIKDLQKRRDRAFRQNNFQVYERLTETVDRMIKNAKASWLRKSTKGTKEWWKRINSERPLDVGSLKPLINSFGGVAAAAAEINDSLIDRFPSSCQLTVGQIDVDSTVEETLTVSPQEVLSAVTKLRNNSAAGPDSLPVWFIKRFITLFVYPLCYIFNLSLRTGSIPTDWKKSEIIPIPKCKIVNSVSNIRPIALTSNLMKVFERLVIEALKPLFFDTIGIEQYAYRPQCSTTIALTQLMHEILFNLDAPRCTIRVAAVDFSKAFDTVEHSLVIGKLTSYGFPFWSTRWLFNFLSERPQRVRLADSVSSWNLSYRGIPQGTVSGPLLFCAMLADLIPPQARTKIIKYADDLTVLHIISNKQTDLFGNCLDYIGNWCEQNGMIINTDKTKEIIFTNVRGDIDIPPAVIRGNVIERVNDVKILGITISNDLKWNRTIKDKISRSKSTLYLLRKVNRFCNRDEYQFLVKSLLLPIITYGYPAWCNIGSQQMQELQKVLRQACRIGNVEEIQLQPHFDHILTSIFRQAQNQHHPLHNIRPTVTPNQYSLRRCIPAIPRSRTERYRKHFVCSGARLLHYNIRN